MLRILLLIVLAILVARALMRVAAGIAAGMARPAQPRRPGDARKRSVPMARDPICGTFDIPDRALRLSDGSREVFFCSATCRDAYRARRTA